MYYYYCIKMDEEERINKLIGIKILSYRKENNITRVKLAKTLNMSHQQLDKYEKGINNLSASKLAIIAKKLQININYFYDDIILSSLKNNTNKKDKEKINTLLKYFFNIKKSQNKELIIELAKELSKINK